MNVDFNAVSVYKKGLIAELLGKSYRNIPSTTNDDRQSFQHFDDRVFENQQWLGVNVFITTVDGVPVGFTSFDPRKRPVAEIGHNCIIPDYRGKGLGLQQMQRLITEIQKRGFEKVIVSTGTSEYFAPARKMYEVCGFVKTGTFDKDGQEMIGYEMELKNVQNQKAVWNEILNEVSGKRREVSIFAKEVNSVIPRMSKMLELGCGLGSDSVFFAKAGHDVLATDFSEVAIESNKDFFKGVPALSFEILDTSKPFPFSDNSFDVVYAHLSLHYFTDDVTKKVFHEIYRVLKNGGYLCFICKSVKDPLYAKGVKIEEDMYQLDGQIRHFFSEDYAKLLLKDLFKIEKIESGEQNFFSRESGYVAVMARAIKGDGLEI